MTKSDLNTLKSAPMAYLGATEPRIRSKPVDLPSKGQEMIDFVEQIINPETNEPFKLLPWQKYLAIEMHRVREDGRWYHSEIGICMARQQGKSTFMALRILAGMYLWGEKMQVHTAHKLTTSSEIFWKIDDIIQANASLAGQFIKKYETKGSQEIKTKNARYLVRANNSASRGIASVDCIHLDETREYQDLDIWASLRFTQMSAKNPMAISYSNAGDQHSVILNSLRARAEAAIAGNNDAIGWFEWSAPDVEIGDTPEFWDAVRYSNPSLGYTVHPDNLRAILNDDESTIKTEVLCRWVNVQNPAINPSAWEAIADKKMKLDIEATTWMAIDLSPDRRSGCLVAAQQIENSDKFKVVLLETYSNPVNIDDKQMANSVADWVKKFHTETVAYSRQTAGAVATRLIPGGISVTPIDGALYGQSCDEMLSAVISGRLIHNDNQEMNKQVLSAVKLPFKDGGWYLGRKVSNATICAAVAMSMVSHFATRPESEADIVFG
jgi:phage terminase large subunit-like protein